MTTSPPTGPHPRSLALRLGDPLRSEFLDELARRATVPWFLARERGVTGGDLTIRLSDDHGPVLALAAGTGEGAPRWRLRQPLDAITAGELFEARRRELEAAGHSPESADALARGAVVELVAAMAAALEHVARLRPEQASLPRTLASGLRAGLALGGDEEFEDGDEDEEFEDEDEAFEDEDEEFEDEEDEAFEDEDEEFEDEEDEDDSDFDEDDEDDEDEDPVAHATAPPRRRRRRRRGLRVLSGLVVLAMVGAVVGFGVAGQSNPATTASTAPPDTAAAAPAPDAIPGHVVHLRNADGTAVRFDPCMTHEYVVQPGAVAPEVAAAEVGAGFAALEEATGLTFRFAGFTADTFPFPIPDGTPPHRPILISYEDPARSRPLLEGAPELGDAARPLGGLAASGPVTVRPGYAVLVGGAAVINQALSPDQRVRVVLHELGHVVGLAHPAGGGQLMTTPVPESGPVAFREGDRAGLAELGAANGCALDDAERQAPVS